MSDIIKAYAKVMTAMALVMYKSRKKWKTNKQKYVDSHIYMIYKHIGNNRYSFELKRGKGYLFIVYFIVPYMYYL